MNISFASIFADVAPVIPIQIAIAIPPLIAGLSHFLRGAGLPQWLNIVLSLFSLIIIGTFCAWITNGFTADLRQSTIVVFGFITLLAGGKEMIDLFSYLEMNPSPLLAIVPLKSQLEPILQVTTTNSPKPLILSAISRAGATPSIVTTPPASGADTLPVTNTTDQPST